MDGVTRQLLCGCLRKMHKIQNYPTYLRGTRLVRLKISRASDDALSENLLLAIVIYFLYIFSKEYILDPPERFWNRWEYHA